MYSWEIDTIMKQNLYAIDIDTYIEICHSSPQISRIKYEPFGTYFEMWTSDDCYWKFSVRKGD